MKSREEWNTNVLEEVRERLSNGGFLTKMVDPESEGESKMLRSTFFLSDRPAEATAMDITFYNIEEFDPIMQIFIYMNKKTDQSRLDAIRESMEEGNRYAPLGHFGFYGEEYQVYYRHSIVFRRQDTVEIAAERVMAALDMMFDVASAQQKNFVTE